MNAKLALAAVVSVAVTGCGGGIEGKVKSQYGDHTQGFAKSAKDIDSVTCTKNATPRYDGWCHIRPKGFHLTYDVPYKGDKVYWGQAGPGKAPS